LSLLVQIEPLGRLAAAHGLHRGAALTILDYDRFIAAQTVLVAPPLVPELRLHLATEITPLWQASETFLEQAGLPPPFWAFAWVGGQALARWLLDHPDAVRGRHVLDFGAGGGIVAIAAMLAGAASAVAADLDGVALAACRLNARLNGVEIATAEGDATLADAAADLILVGDVCYERAAAQHITTWLTAQAARGRTVLLGDPGRTFLPAHRLQRIAEYTVETSRELEDRTARETGVWRLL
jgi:predicted nicotinamide N-methyase